MAEAVRAIGVTEPTYHCWRWEYGELKLDQMKRLKQLEGKSGRQWKAVVALRPKPDRVSTTRRHALLNGGADHSMEVGHNLLRFRHDLNLYPPHPCAATQTMFETPKSRRR